MSYSELANVTCGVDGAGAAMLTSVDVAAGSGSVAGELRSMMKVSRREAGVAKVINSFVGETATFAAGVSLGVAGTRLPFRFARARGSIDLRRRLPPRGIRVVSMA